MKKHIIFSFLIPVVCMIMMLNSCSKEDYESTRVNSSAIENSTTGDIDQLIPVADMFAKSEIIQESATSEFKLKDVPVPNDVPEGIELDEKSNSFYCTGKKENSFVKFLNSLNLSLEQKRKLKAAFTEHLKCKFEIEMMMKRVQKEILAKFNAQKEELVRKYKNGEITERELKAAMEKLQQRAKLALDEAIAKLNLKEKMQRCYRVYLEKVKMILTAEQWEKWVRWHKNGDTGKGGTKQ